MNLKYDYFIICVILDDNAKLFYDSIYEYVYILFMVVVKNTWKFFFSTNIYKNCSYVSNMDIKKLQRNIKVKIKFLFFLKIRV